MDIRDKTCFAAAVWICTFIFLLLGLLIGAKVRNENKMTGGEMPQNRQIRELSFWEKKDTAPVIERTVLIREEKGTMVRFFLSDEDICEKLESPQLMDQIQDIFEKYEVDSWADFHGNNENILDGVSFGLEAVFTDGQRLSARGNNAFPENYQQVFQALDALTMPVFKKLQIEPGS